MFLLRREEPWVIAVVLSYLRPEFARQALSMLPLEIQAKVAMEALTVRQITKDQVRAIDAQVKENVDFVVGGVDRLTRMLEDSDPGTRQNILEYLKTQKPATYERLKKSILTFEDMGHFPDKDMQIVIRGLNTEDIAKALQKAPPEVADKFFANMSERAGAMLKETMEYFVDITPVQMEEARMKIIDVIKTLEKEGKITVREQNSDEARIDEMEISAENERRKKLENIAGMDASQSSAAQPAGGQFGQYLEAGTALYNEGRYEESMQYLQYAVSGDPSLWQAYQYLGAACYALGRAQEAVQFYEKYALESNDPAVKDWVANFKQNAGKS